MEFDNELIAQALHNGTFYEIDDSPCKLCLSDVWPHIHVRHPKIDLCSKCGGKQPNCGNSICFDD